MGSKAIATIGLIPLLAHYLTATELAIWTVFISLQGLQLLIESGVTSVLIRVTAYARGGSDKISGLTEHRSYASGNASTNWKLYRSIESISLPLYSGVGAATAIFLLLMGYLGAADRIAELPIPTEGWIALIVTVVSSGFRAYSGRYQAVLYGFERITESRLAEAGSWVFCICATMAVAWLSRNLMYTTIVYAFTTTTYAIAMYFLQRALVTPPAHIEAHDGEYGRTIRKETFASIWQSSLGVFLYLAVFQGTALEFSRHLDSEKATAFLLIVNLTRYVMQFVQVPCMVAIPALALYRSQGDLAAQQRIASEQMRISFILLAAMEIAIALFANPLIARFGGHSTALLDMEQWRLVCIAMFFERHGGMHLQLYSTTGHIIWHWLNASMAAIFFVAMFLLERAGIPYAWAFSYIVASIFYDIVSSWYSYRMFRLPIPRFELQTSVIPAAVALITFGAIIFAA